MGPVLQFVAGDAEADVFVGLPLRAEYLALVFSGMVGGQSRERSQRSIGAGLLVTAFYHHACRLSVATISGRVRECELFYSSFAAIDCSP